MVAKAAAVTHGSVTVRYSTEKDLSEIVKVNCLPENLSASAIWSRMKLLQEQFREKLNRTKHLKCTSLRIEVSPAREETVGWTLEEWRELADDFVREFDAVDYSGRTGRESSKSTNLKNTQYVAMLHHDSDSGILHLHIIANRIDMDGNVIDSHYVSERAKQAACVINERRGWVQPEEIHKERAVLVTQDCIAALKEMDTFDWDAYKQKLEGKGYKVVFRLDEEGKIHGYSLNIGYIKYKSSELGHTRSLTPARILETWAKLHPVKEENVPAEKTEKPRPVAVDVTKRPTPAPEPVPAMVHQDITVEGQRYSLDIPEAIYEIFQKEAEVPENNSSTSREHVLHTAMLLFCEYVDGATALSQSCGGGSSPGTGWGKDPKEDDWMWARRCLKKAQNLHERPYTYRRHR